ncbi:hypothetical protein Nepgr_017775 [Nepenthes gracilis]|uniref:Cytochrome P450 n=1 Tax=Nepenthes gracilis TaxID=150966 RepID=A0AAD3SS69_NEPGR|nr:hypothetical protein Nepgr_017775 [Nepenthes gracilis]
MNLLSSFQHIKSATENHFSLICLKLKEEKLFCFPEVTKQLQGIFKNERLMEEERFSFITKSFWLLLVFTALALLAKLVVHLWWRPRKIAKHFSKQGIKGPPYRFFIGNMKDLVELMTKAASQPMPLSHNVLPRVLPFYHHWKKIYGATYLIWFGPNPRLTISDPALIREIFSTSSELFEKYESHPTVRKLEGNGLISLKGETWAHRRKIISPIFHTENLRLMVPIMGKSVAAMLDRWSGLSNSGKVEIEVSEWFQNLSEEVITRTIFGSSYEDGKEIYKLQAQQIVFAAESFQKVFVPGYRFLPTSRNRQSWRLDGEIERLLTRLIDRRRQAAGDRRRSSEERPRDLLERLMEEGLRGDEIVEECKSFFFAGKHTTSSLLTWTTVLLAMHPQWQQLARDEVLRVCGARDIPTKDDVANLKTLGMIVYESLRLYPPTVAMIRRSKNDVELGRIKIPKGTEILIPILAVHHDSTVWGSDVSEFNPARFTQGIARTSKHPTAFMPFGLGARQCIGQNLAVLQVKMTVAMILQRFSFDLSPNYNHAPTISMFLYPQFNAPVIFHNL